MEKYIENIKRLYLNDELDTEKGEKILGIKAKIFKISNEEAAEAKLKIKTIFDEVKNLAEDLINFNDNKTLSESDLNEIIELGIDLGLTKEEVLTLLDSSDLYKQNEMTSLEKTEMIGKLEKIQADKENAVELGGYTSEFISKYELKFYTEIDELKIHTLILDILDKSYANFLTNISEYNSIDEFTRENIITLYTNEIVTPLIELQKLLLQNGLIYFNLSDADYLYRVCNDSYINNFINKMDEINYAIDNELETINSSNLFNSNVYGNLESVVKYDLLGSICNSIGDSLQRGRYRNKANNIIYPQVINECVSLTTAMHERSIFGFKSLTLGKNLRFDRIVDTLLFRRDNANAIINNLTKNIVISKEVQIENLLTILKEYPFKSFLFKKFLELNDDLSTSEILKVLELGKKILVNTIEYSEFKTVYSTFTKQIYDNMIKQVSNESNKENLMNDLLEAKTISKIDDMDYIAKKENELLNTVISNLDYNEVSKETKFELYKSFLHQIKYNNLTFIRDNAMTFLDKIKLDTILFNDELEIIGTLVVAYFNKENKDDAKEILELGLNSIKLRDISDSAKNEIINDLIDKVGLNKDFCRTYEEKIFGKIISYSNSEENSIAKIDNQIFNIYQKYDTDILDETIKLANSESFYINLNIDIDEIPSLKNTKILFSYDLISTDDILLFLRDGITFVSDLSIFISYNTIDKIIFEYCKTVDSSGLVSYPLCIKFIIDGAEAVSIPYNNDMDELKKTYLYYNILFISDVLKFFNKNFNLIDMTRNNNKPNYGIEIDLDAVLQNNIYYNMVRNILNSNLYEVLDRAIKNANMNNKNSIFTQRDSKVREAKSTYANVDRQEIIYFGVDNTLFKSGKAGALFTDRGIYTRPQFGNNIFIEYSTITKIDRTTNSLLLNNQNEIELNMASNIDDLQEFLEFATVLLKDNANKKGLLKGKIDFDMSNGLERSNFIEIVKEISYRIINTEVRYDLRDRLYIQGDSDYDKKIANIRAFFEINPHENVFLVYDNTIFKSGKGGFVISNEYVYFKNLIGKQKFMRIDEIFNISFNSDKLVLSGVEIDCYQMNNRDREGLLAVLNVLVTGVGAYLRQDENSINEILELKKQFNI